MMHPAHKKEINTPATTYKVQGCDIVNQLVKHVVDDALHIINI